MMDRESDHCVVPMKPSNVGRGKAGTYHRSCYGHIFYTQG
ncbi:hypothetical protein Theco_3811 [Thermobacillus composti KWC4]|uniref:Uncharacterized protein n=1 Tax=Thermobacillus composti (strain DSM 18247 / JCM 13945 / KWC4) TaxID=717605 RepID=L0EEE1_THECK|nr:hypothetical protein Theco_2553 [Thermobacillus composti KWC4]AGA59823.1 hypothetical protein Theco_3811 [Thermobacillus composti KWC4]